MSQKKKKICTARDAIVSPEHIQVAQVAMFKSSPGEIMKKVHSVEPELAHYIMAAAKDIAANAMIECEMPRPVALHLGERVTALALSVYGAYNIAVYQHYKDLFKGTAVEGLDAEPEPPFPPAPPAPPPAPPSDGEQGGPCGII